VSDGAPFPQPDNRLFRLLWLAIAAAVATISLKTLAWLLTGSVGLLSDAAESVVNLVAAIVALAALRWAAKPADEEHTYGHAKAEYFSAGIEGALILIAAVTIAVTAIDRLMHPQPLEDVSIGLAISVGASLINLVVGLLLLRAGREHRSITLEADGKHLLTDVWTSAGVLVGVAAVAISGWERLDAIVALAVAVNIVHTGTVLLRRSAGGLMDRALPEVHILVPGEWTVQQGHDIAEEVEASLHHGIPSLTVFTHVEPIEDPRSFDDTALDRRCSATARSR
jgi:cation diffusion facilitator family transporter